MKVQGVVDVFVFAAHWSSRKLCWQVQGGVHVDLLIAGRLIHVVSEAKERKSRAKCGTGVEVVQDVGEKSWLVHDVGMRDCNRGGSTRCRRQRLYQQGLYAM